ncbi:hypothetical protein ACFTZI_00025 [Streptomyces decoyicus]|uniref:hypothetical protein n=1 Tax=Streptomyces decoyicus TaxID=249567 RepID=UPI0036281AA7
MTHLDGTPNPGYLSSSGTSPVPTPQSSAQPPDSEPPLMTLRTFVILIVAVGVGVVVGVLTELTGTPPAGSVLAGLFAFGGTLYGLPKLVGG